MSERIYVTGCAGMIGSNICAALVNGGHQVVGVDNLWRGSPQNMAAFRPKENFTFRHADVASDSQWHRDVDSDSVIVHTADIVAGIGFVFQNEWLVFHRNLLINTQIAQLVQVSKPRQLIYLGTACSYPMEKQRSREHSVLMESDKYPAQPESGYGWSKLVGDIEFQLAVKGTPTRLMVLDLHNVYGWPCVYADETAQVIPALISRAMECRGGPLEVWGNGEQGRAFVHVSDVVQAVEKSLSYSGDETNIMIGPGKCTSIKEVAEIICSHPAIAVSELAFDTSKPTGDIGRHANAERAMRELGWRESISLEEGVFQLIDRIAEDRGR